ncbi:phosphate/phosphite/phosphonate ABC transporter substrate-binding protein [Bradyrhizobium sp. USDA 336]|uniref:phosphate/phosphite/phosphonate ABC transporter substrate-binding protein n=1 Tax=Bradyrhizobium sp. USDA 336 TaxID=3156311 RepID=UPI0038342B0C
MRKICSDNRAQLIRSKRVELAYIGPAAYARLWIITNGQVEPLAKPVDLRGAAGYYSVVIVRSDSSYHALDDLKGKKFGFNDPNSTSGYQAPKYYLRKTGYDIDTFFATTIFTGSDDNNITTLLSGAVDGATSWWQDDSRSAIKRVEDKGLIPQQSVRIIWKSPMLPSDPRVAPTWLPERMRSDLRDAIVSMAKDDPEALRALAAAGNLARFVAASRRRLPRHRWDSAS